MTTARFTALQQDAIDKITALLTIEVETGTITTYARNTVMQRLAPTDLAAIAPEIVRFKQMLYRPTRHGNNSGRCQVSGPWEDFFGEPEHKAEKNTPPDGGTVITPPEGVQSLQSLQSLQSNIHCEIEKSDFTVCSVSSSQMGEKSHRERIQPKSEAELIIETVYRYDWYPDYDHFVIPMFRLAGQLSKYPSLRGRSADVVADYVEAILAWRELPGIDDDETGRDQFIASWQALEPWPLGKEVYVIALKEAEKELLPVKRAEGVKVTHQFTKVVNFCYRLDEAEGGNPFMLSARTLADAIGIHFTNAAPYINRLVFEKFIAVVEKPRTKMQRAGRYRFIGKREGDCLTPRTPAI